MSKAKWALMFLTLILGGAPAWACDDAVPVSTVGESLFGIKILPAVLHIPGPGEEPLYGGLTFAKAPAILPQNLCEARCLAGFRDEETLLNACAATCSSRI